MTKEEFLYRQMREILHIAQNAEVGRKGVALDRIGEIANEAIERVDMADPSLARMTLSAEQLQADLDQVTAQYHALRLKYQELCNRYGVAMEAMEEEK